MASEYCFEVRRNGRWVYVGKARATLADIRAAFPYSEVEGNSVRIFHHTP